MTFPVRVPQVPRFDVGGALARVPGGGLVLTGPRTARWATAAVLRRSDRAPAGRPRPVPNPRLTLGVALDEAVLGAMVGLQRATPTREEEIRIGADLQAAAELADARGWVADPRTYHREPPPLTDAEVTVRRARWLRTRYEAMTFPSGFAPRPEEPAADRHPALGTPNDTVHVHLFRHRQEVEDRPWVVLVHGFGMGFPAADLTSFDIGRLHHQLGANLAMVVLPMHGARRTPGHGMLLSLDLAASIHGIAQAAWDVRRLIRWVRTQTTGTVSLYGISLGGYTTALVAGLEPLDAAIAGVPVVDLPAVFARHAPRRDLARAHRRGVLGPSADAAFQVVSPLRLAPQVPHEHLAIHAGIGDRFVPSRHAESLWEAWGHPATRWYPGGHIGFMWSPKVRDFVAERLAAVA